MLRSLRAAFAALALCLALPNAFAFKDYQDWWWDAAQSGMGFNIGQQGSTVFVMWFLYGDDGKGTFLQLSGAMSDDGFLQGTLYQSTGPVPGPAYNAANVRNTAVGTGSIRFNSEHDAVFTYSYGGKTGSINLQRFTFKYLDITGTRIFAAAGQTSSCSNSANNGGFLASGIFHLTQNGGSNYTLTSVEDEGYTCSRNLSLTQSGITLRGSGQFSCSDGSAGNITVSSIRKIDEVLVVEYRSKYTAGETCEEKGKLVATE
jgi:hypothetical protein